MQATSTILQLEASSKSTRGGTRQERLNYASAWRARGEAKCRVGALCARQPNYCDVRWVEGSSPPLQPSRPLKLEGAALVLSVLERGHKLFQGEQHVICQQACSGHLDSHLARAVVIHHAMYRQAAVDV